MFPSSDARRMRTLVALVATLTMVVSSACSDSPHAMLSPSNTPTLNRDTPANSSSPSPREHEVIEQMIQRFPEAHRAEVRERFATQNLIAMSTADPELVRLADELDGLRRARGAESVSRRAMTTHELVQSAKKQGRILVDVVLAPSHGPRVSIVRRPGDDGVPMLVMGAADVTPEELSAGLRAAASSVKHEGVSPTAESRVGVRVAHDAKHKTSSPASLEHFHANAKEKEVPGFGRVRMIRVATAGH